MKVTICGKIAINVTAIKSIQKKGSTPLNISDGDILSAFATANTFIPIGGVNPAISHMKTNNTHII